MLNVDNQCVKKSLNDIKQSMTTLHVMLQGINHVEADGV